jgi:hypothetical protein
MAVNTACRLNVFDLIEKGYNTPEMIGKEIQGNVNSIRLLLNAMVQIDFLQESKSSYCLTEISELLTESNPESLKNACVLWGIEHLNAWQDLEYSIKTGMPSFNNLFGEPFFDYLSHNPEKLLNYHKAMYEYANDDYSNICKVYDFKSYNKIMDVGGGFGALISAIKKINPHKHCYLFEKPEVLQISNTSEIELISGDFFNEIPNVADCIILSRVLHDWEDDEAIQILRNAYIGLPNNGEVLIIENLTDKISNEASLLSLNMLAICKSFERTESEYIQLLASSGFKYLDTIKLNELQYIIKAIKQ